MVILNFLAAPRAARTGRARDLGEQENWGEAFQKTNTYANLALRPLKRGMLGASTVILFKDIGNYAFMCGSNFYETEVTIWRNIDAFPRCSEMTSTRFKYNITKLLDFIKKQKMNEYEVSHLYQAKVQLLLSSLQSSQKEKIWVTSCHARVCTQKTKLGSIFH